jgi:hypothetical protein
LSEEFEKKFSGERDDGHTVYEHFKSTVNERSSLYEKLDAQAYIGERS